MLCYCPMQKISIGPANSNNKHNVFVENKNMFPKTAEAIPSFLLGVF